MVIKVNMARVEDYLKKNVKDFNGLDDYLVAMDNYDDLQVAEGGGYDLVDEYYRKGDLIRVYEGSGLGEEVDVFGYIIDKDY